MTLSGLDVIARGDDFEDRAASYEFRSWQWALLHALDGKEELRDVAMTSGVDLETALDLVHEAQSAGLVHVVSMTLDEYRRSIGLASPHAAVMSPPQENATLGDHFSSTDTLGSYETPVPAWMIEHHDAPAEASHEEPAAAAGVEHEAEAEAAPEPAPASSWYQPAPAVAEHHDEAVAEHHDEAVAEHQDEAVAEHHDEAVAEHHDEAVADDGTPWYMRTATASVAHEEPAVAEHHEEAVAEREPEAAVEDTPWYVRSQAAPAAAPAVELHDVTSPELYHDPYADQVVAERVEEPAAEAESIAQAHSTNGHSTTSSWEPMSLVTNVDEATPVHAFDAVSHDVPEGVSIHLSSHSEPHDFHDTLSEPEPEKGSISFSFSADDFAEKSPVIAAAEHDTPGIHRAAVAPAPAVPPEPVAVANDSYTAHDETVAAPEASSQSQPAVEAPKQMEPAMSASQAQPAAAPAPTTSATADIVGNLISRALTFRIK